MSGENWPHGEHVTSFRGMRLRYFSGISFGDLADARELVEAGAPIAEVADELGISVEQMSRNLGLGR